MLSWQVSCYNPRWSDSHSQPRRKVKVKKITTRISFHRLCFSTGRSHEMKGKVLLASWQAVSSSITAVLVKVLTDLGVHAVIISWFNSPPRPLWKIDLAVLHLFRVRPLLRPPSLLDPDICVGCFLLISLLYRVEGRRCKHVRCNVAWGITVLLKKLF